MNRVVTSSGFNFRGVRGVIHFWILIIINVCMYSIYFFDSIVHANDDEEYISFSDAMKWILFIIVPHLITVANIEIKIIYPSLDIKLDILYDINSYCCIGASILWGQKQLLSLLVCKSATACYYDSF